MNHDTLNLIKKSILVGGILFLTTNAFAKTFTVTMKSISYDPKVLSIKVGDAVEWLNKSYTEHSATSVEAQNQIFKFDTGLIQPKNKSEKVEFKEPGVFSYHCSIHGKSMSGKVEVTP